MNNLFIKIIKIILKNQVISFEYKKSQYILAINSKHIFDVCFFLRDSETSLFKVLVDIAVVDFPNVNNRFCLNYCLLSVKYNTRIILKTELNELTPIDSITKIHKSACWIEREVWDMFGIFFEKHPDLRRLLTDYGFNGYPLRKDFPLTGYLEMRYDDSQKRIVFEPIEMTQEYRVFHFKNSWNFNLNKVCD
jgi:NADH-quinone oxidoreductase subunit C